MGTPGCPGRGCLPALRRTGQSLPAPCEAALVPAACQRASPLLRCPRAPWHRGAGCGHGTGGGSIWCWGGERGSPTAPVGWSRARAWIRGMPRSQTPQGMGWGPRGPWIKVPGRTTRAWRSRSTTPHTSPAACSQLRLPANPQSCGHGCPVAAQPLPCPPPLPCLPAGLCQGKVPVCRAAPGAGPSRGRGEATFGRDVRGLRAAQGAAARRGGSPPRGSWAPGGLAGRLRRGRSRKHGAKVAGGGDTLSVGQRAGAGWSTRGGKGCRLAGRRPRRGPGGGRHPPAR